MTIRERLEQQEYMLLAPNAQKAAETKGRLYPAEENEVRTCYQRDADRIVHSKSFRRLMHQARFRRCAPASPMRPLQLSGRRPLPPPALPR